jgi:hypothetical protein
MSQNYFHIKKKRKNDEEKKEKRINFARKKKQTKPD